MRVALVRAVLALTVAAAATACGKESTTQPKTTTRYYLLKSIDGGPLPYNLGTDPAGPKVFVVYDALTLKSDGTASRTRTIREVAGSMDETTTQTGSYTYHVSGTRITLVPGCPPGAMCVPGEVGTISEEQLTLSLNLDNTPPSPVWQYTRIAPD
jgi:hypothetical protein